MPCGGSRLGRGKRWRRFWCRGNFAVAGVITGNYDCNKWAGDVGDNTNIGEFWIGNFKISQSPNSKIVLVLVKLAFKIFYHRRIFQPFHITQF